MKVAGCQNVSHSVCAFCGVSKVRTMRKECEKPKKIYLGILMFVICYGGLVGDIQSILDLKFTK